MNIDIDFKVPPRRKLWGEITDELTKFPPTAIEQIITPKSKQKQIDKLVMDVKNVFVKMEEVDVDNPLVSQTVEVMNQTEMLQTLVDAYSTKAGFNSYLINACPVIPQVNFPAENTAELLNNKKFAKPIWYIPPMHTHFTKGITQDYKRIDKKVCREVIKKAICGVARLAGFNDITAQALTTFAEGVEEYLKNLFVQFHDVNLNDDDESNYKLDIMTIEKGYFANTHSSLLTMHNYFKNDVIGRNRTEIDEFNTIYHEYDHMMKESQNIEIGDEDIMNFLDFAEPVQNTDPAPYASAVSQEQQQAENEVINLTLMNLLKSDNLNNNTRSNNFHDIFEADLIEATLIAHQECVTAPVMAPPISSLENWSLKNL